MLTEKYLSNGSSIKLPTVPRERIIHAVLPKGSVGTGHAVHLLTHPKMALSWFV